MSFQTRIEDYVGTVADTAAMTSWLTEAAKKLVDLVPPNKVDILSLPSNAVTGAGLTISHWRPIEVVCEGRMARKVHKGLAADIEAASGSLYEGTDLDPAWYITGNKVFVSNTTSAYIHYLPYPSVAFDDVDGSIANWPQEWEEIIVLDAASKAQAQAINLYITTLDAIAYSAPSAPSAPAAPSFTFTPDTADTISAVTLTGVTVGAVPSDPVFTVTLPVPVPTLDVSALFTIVETYLDTNKDIELAEEKLREIDRKIQNYAADIRIWTDEATALLQEARGEFEEKVAGFRAAWEKVLKQAEIDNQQDIEQNRLTQAKNFEQARLNLQAGIEGAWKATQKQIAEYEASLGKYRAEIQAYAAEIQGAIADFQGQLTLARVRIEDMRAQFLTLRSLYNDALKLLLGVGLEAQKNDSN
jgi:hypothetical protein